MQRRETTLQQRVNVATKSDNWVPHANEISVEALVNMLVKKGVFSADELFQLEGQIRDENIYKQETGFININQRQQSNGPINSLKRKMGKKRWTRRLGTFLFGWKWKKVKKSP